MVTKPANKHSMGVTGGGYFDLLNPDPRGIQIYDIANALSNLCRFNGHVPFFYSVAQHSLLVEQIVRDHGGDVDDRLSALMHDAEEAYVGDMINPMKNALGKLGCLDFTTIAIRVNDAIMKRYKLKGGLSLIKAADRMACELELSILRGDNLDSYLNESYNRYRSMMVNKTTDDIKHLFIKMFYDLWDERNAQRVADDKRQLSLWE